MKRIFVMLVIGVLPMFIHAQNRIPEKGENIIFYPLNKDYIAANTEYDCFYATEQIAKKENVYTFKDKFRFNKNENQKTPASEIEGFTFNVLSKQTLSVKDKKVLLIFLRRIEDGKLLTMRIPYYIEKKSNHITNSFLLGRKYSFGITDIYINIPYINKDSLLHIKDAFLNKKVVYDYSIKNYETWRNRNDDLKLLMNKLNDTSISLSKPQMDSCIDIGFKSIEKHYIYQQLIVTNQQEDGKMYNVPMSYFVGEPAYCDTKNDGVFLFLPAFFKTKEEYVKEKIEKWKVSYIVEKFSGQKVYYGLQDKYIDNHNNRDYNAFENRNNLSNEIYNLSEGVYDCINFDVIKKHDTNRGDYDAIFAILKDDKGIEFRVPAIETIAGDNHLRDGKTKEFDKYFVLKSEADSIIRVRKEIALQQEVEAKNKYQTLTQKYGTKYATFLMDLNATTFNKFERCARKYGKNNAMLMINGKVRYGWTYEMCEESWGIPNSINRTTGVYGVSEQWVYELSYGNYYNMKCLYFENGVLTTIQD